MFTVLVYIILRQSDADVSSDFGSSAGGIIRICTVTVCTLHAHVAIALTGRDTTRTIELSFLVLIFHTIRLH